MRKSQLERRHDWWHPIFLAIMLALCGCCSLFDGAQAWAQQPVGAARIVVNDVRGTLPAVRAPVTLRIGADLVQNEVIDTAVDSATLVAFPDDSRLAICPSAEVVLKRAEFGPSPTGPTLVVFIPYGCTQYSSGLLLKTALFRTPSTFFGQSLGTTKTGG